MKLDQLRSLQRQKFKLEKADLEGYKRKINETDQQIPLLTALDKVVHRFTKATDTFKREKELMDGFQSIIFKCMLKIISSAEDIERTSVSCKKMIYNELRSKIGILRRAGLNWPDLAVVENSMKKYLGESSDDDATLKRLAAEVEEASHWSEIDTIIDSCMHTIERGKPTETTAKNSLMKVLLTATKFILESKSTLRHRASEAVIETCEQLKKKYGWAELETIVDSLKPTLKEGFGDDVLKNYKNRVGYLDDVEIKGYLQKHFGKFGEERQLKHYYEDAKKRLGEEKLKEMMIKIVRYRLLTDDNLGDVAYGLKELGLKAADYISEEDKTKYMKNKLRGFKGEQPYFFNLMRGQVETAIHAGLDWPELKAFQKSIATFQKKA